MNNGIGKGKTREDHRELSNQLYACYAHGREIRKLMAIVGEDALGDLDRKYLGFAKDFEEHMVGQGATRRSVEDTLDLGWNLLTMLPKAELKRIRDEYLGKYLPQAQERTKSA